MTTDKESIDQIHLIIHSLRLIGGYKASEAEKKVSKIVIEHFKDCKECQEVAEQLKNVKPKQGIISKIKGAID